MKTAIRFFKFFYSYSYEANMCGAYIMLIISFIFAFKNTDFRLYKTYYNLLAPLPIVGLIISQVEEQKIEADLEYDEFLLEASKIEPEVCRGCKYYHGQEYNQVNLICAIHPQGVEGDECLDYESHTQNI